MSHNQDPTQPEQALRYYTLSDIAENNRNLIPMDLQPGAVIWGMEAKLTHRHDNPDDLFGDFDRAEMFIQGGIKRLLPAAHHWSDLGLRHVSNAAKVRKFYGAYENMQVMIVPNEESDESQLREKYDLLPDSPVVTVLYMMTLKSSGLSARSTPVATKRVYAAARAGMRGDDRPDNERQPKIVALTESSANEVWEAQLQHYKDSGHLALAAAMANPYQGGAPGLGKDH